MKLNSELKEKLDNLEINELGIKDSSAREQRDDYLDLIESITLELKNNGNLPLGTLRKFQWISNELSKFYGYKTYSFENELETDPSDPQIVDGIVKHILDCFECTLYNKQPCNACEKTILNCLEIIFKQYRKPVGSLW